MNFANSQLDHYNNNNNKEDEEKKTWSAGIRHEESNI